MAIEFEILELVPLRVEGKASLAEVVVDAQTREFTTAALAQFGTNHHLTSWFLSCGLLWMNPEESLQAILMQPGGR